MNPTRNFQKDKEKVIRLCDLLDAKEDRKYPFSAVLMTALGYPPRGGEDWRCEKLKVSEGVCQVQQTVG